MFVAGVSGAHSPKKSKWVLTQTPCAPDRFGTIFTSWALFCLKCKPLCTQMGLGSPRVHFPAITSHGLMTLDPKVPGQDSMLDVLDFTGRFLLLGCSLACVCVFLFVAFVLFWGSSYTTIYSN